MKHAKNQWRDDNGKWHWRGKRYSHGTYRKHRKPNSRFVKHV